MQKILLFTFIIFSYNILLLILPLLIFITSLSFANQILLNIIPWIYSPFVLLSPLLTIGLGYLVIRDRLNPFSWPIPIIISLISSSPFLWLYCLFSSLGNPIDYFLLIGLPVLFGLLADLIAFGANSFRQFVARVKPY